MFHIFKVKPAGLIKNNFVIKSNSCKGLLPLSLSVLALIFILNILILNSIAYAQYKNWEYNPTVILSLSLARSGDLIPPADMTEVVNSLTETGMVPNRYRNTFLRMLGLAQILLEIKSSSYYFPVGYEFESAHGEKESWDQFKKGAVSLAKTVNQTFGISTEPKLKNIIKEGSEKEIYSFLDDAGQSWNIVPEHVRDDYATVTTGWETVTPPMFNPDYLRNMASFVLGLGANKYGRSAELTGGHQTYQAYPMGKAYDKNIQGLIIANYLLLKQQYIVSIFKLLEVQRFGGSKNFFIRPLMLDHSEMLQEIAAANPKSVTPEYLAQLLNGKYGVKEFDSHINYADNYDEEEKIEMAGWPVSKKLVYVKNWKYRDTRVKFIREGLVLLEDRLGEFRTGEPDYSMKVTYFNQLLLKAATKLAEQGQIYQLQLPPRKLEESDTNYWARLAKDPSMSTKKLLAELSVDATEKNLLFGRKFQTRKPAFQVLPKPSWGFEMEFVGHQFVDIVVPKDPLARAKWRSLSRKKKIDYVASLIADEDMQAQWLKEGSLTYNPDMRRIVTVEFEADTTRFPFLDPDLFIEDSGNFEIKTNGRDVFDFKDLKSKIKEITKVIGDYGMHVHLFIPETYLKDFYTNPELADKAANLLERVSLYLVVDGYHEVKAKDNYHALDSWSLDRYSPKDIASVRAWLKGERGGLDNIAQKYHNVGFRVVNGGIDIEGRDLGDDVELAELVMKSIYQGFIEKSFIDLQFGAQGSDLFFEFRDYKAKDKKAIKKFTLSEALSAKYNLTLAQKDILHKLQFEIYKPSMYDYMMFGDNDAWNSVEPKALDPAQARTNFESDVAMPIWNFEEQAYLQQLGLDGIFKARENYIEKVMELVRKLETQSKYGFILQEADFLYLADWMQRSAHPNKPKLDKVDKTTARAQRKILENLVYELRSYVVDFVHEAHLRKMVLSTIDGSRPKSSRQIRCELFL